MVGHQEQVLRSKVWKENPPELRAKAVGMEKTAPPRKRLTDREDYTKQDD